VAQASGSLIASRHISQIAELEGKVRKLTVCLLRVSMYCQRWRQDKTPLLAPVSSLTPPLRSSKHVG
jgi:hypothetical protein